MFAHKAVFMSAEKNDDFRIGHYLHFNILKLFKATLFNKAFTHLKFRAHQLKTKDVMEKIHPNTGQKTTWGVLTDSLVVIFRGVCISIQTLHQKLQPRF